MDYISAKEAAEAWNTHVRVVQEMCKNGRIPGAARLGRAWLIPHDAMKPADPRRATHERAPRYLSWGLLTARAPVSSEAAADLVNTPARQAQHRAEIDYLRGDFSAVKAYFDGVSPTEETYLCAANIAIAAAMATGDYPLFQRISAAVGEIAHRAPSGADRRAAEILPAFAAVCMNAHTLAPDWLVRGDFADFPPEARLMLIFMRVKYLQSVKNKEGMLAAAQTALTLMKDGRGPTLVTVYLTGLCACALYALGRPEEARDWLDSAVAVCEKCGFVSPLGEYTTWLGGMLEISLKRCDPAFEGAVLRHIEGTFKNWLFFHNEFARDNASLILTTREYQLAVLLKEGKSYARAAKQMCLSVGRTKNMVSGIYAKLGISRKAELVRMVY